MKRFKNWLIHKLGGYTKEDVRKIEKRLEKPTQFFLSECKREVKRMHSMQTFTPATKYIADAYIEELKQRLLNDLLPEFRKAYKPEVICRFDAQNYVYEYSIILEYLVPEKDNGEQHEM